MSSDGARALHPNTVSRAPSPEPSVHEETTVVADGPAPNWEEDVTRPGDPSDLAALASKSIASVVSQLPAAPLAPAPPVLPVSAVPSLRAETDRTIAVRVPPRDLRTRTIAIAAASALGGLGAGYLLWGGGGGAVATSVRAPVAISAPVVKPPPPAPKPVTPAVAPAPQKCSARFADAPDGANVQWGDAQLGVTPFKGDVDVPCGDATVVLTHPRYERLERATTASPGAPAIVDAGMKRPLGMITLRSEPAGAKFTVDGEPVTGGEAKVHAYTQVSIVAEMPGYASAARKVYVRGPHDSVVIPLAAAPRHR